MRGLVALALLAVGGCSAPTPPLPYYGNGGAATPPTPSGPGLVQTQPAGSTPLYGAGGAASAPVPVGLGWVMKQQGPGVTGPNIGANQPMPWHPQ